MNETSYEPDEPYEIARRAFFKQFPKAKDIDWQQFISENTADSNGQFDNYSAFAILCDINLIRFDDLEDQEEEDELFEFVAAHNYFEERQDVVDALVSKQYMNGNVPHHLKVYKGRINVAGTSSHQMNKYQ